jgi:hypothetical protein
VGTAGFIGVSGASLLTSLPSSAASNTGSGVSSGAASSNVSASAAPDLSKGGHQANGKTETVLTGDAATKATYAAQAAVPGATILRVETDADGATYEAHMKKSDGTFVSVKMDASFKVTGTENGPGGGHGRPNDNDADDSAGGGSSSSNAN